MLSHDKQNLWIVKHLRRVSGNFLLYTKILLFFYHKTQKISGLLVNFRIAMLPCYRGFSLSGVGGGDSTNLCKRSVDVFFLSLPQVSTRTMATIANSETKSFHHFFVGNYIHRGDGQTLRIVDRIGLRATYFCFTTWIFFFEYFMFLFIIL